MVASAGSGSYRDRQAAWSSWPRTLSLRADGGGVLTGRQESKPQPRLNESRSSPVVPGELMGTVRRWTGDAASKVPGLPVGVGEVVAGGEGVEVLVAERGGHEPLRPALAAVRTRVSR